MDEGIDPAGQQSVTVVGVGEDGWDGLSDGAREALRRAAVIAGSARQLALLPELGVRCVPLPSPLLPRLGELVRDNPGLCLLASGDPMLHGIGATLARRIGPARLTVVPAVSSVALACARLGWPEHEAALVSLVAQPPEAALAAMRPGARVLLLCRDGRTPAAVARLLAGRGWAGSELTVLERLGGPAERVTGPLRPTDLLTGDPGAVDLTTAGLTTAGLTTDDLSTDDLSTGDRTTGDLSTGDRTTDDLSTGRPGTDDAATARLTRDGGTAGRQAAGERMTGGPAGPAERMPGAAGPAERMPGAAGPAERMPGAAEQAAGEFADLCVLAVRPQADGPAPAAGRVPGLPDAAFETDGQITRRELRALALTALRPGPGELLWDVGAGSGSIGVEWLRAEPLAEAIAVEARADRADRARRNAGALGVPGLRVVCGQAPAALGDLPAPDAVFIGGGLTADGLLETCWRLLAPGGRLVAHAVTVESEAVLHRWAQAEGGQLVRAGFSYLEPLGSFTTWRPALPVIQWQVAKS